METRISTVGLMKNNVFCDFLRFFVIFAVFCDFRVFLDFQAVFWIFRGFFWFFRHFFGIFGFLRGFYPFASSVRFQLFSDQLFTTKMKNFTETTSKSTIMTATVTPDGSEALAKLLS